MATTVYPINKGINSSLEFRGLKAQYIWYLAGGLVAVLILFAILYISGVNAYMCIAIALVTGGGLFVYVYKLNNQYGQYGLMRKAAQRKVPKTIKCQSRKKFVREGSDGKKFRGHITGSGRA